MLSWVFAVLAQAEPHPLFRGETARPLRYQPDGRDFLIVNGAEFFNRPLYGSNTAFRLDAGDLPEFTLYLPGRGGNLRIGVKQGSAAKWLFNAERIETRYGAGEMRYDIRDPLLGAGTLRLQVLALSDTEGLIATVTLAGTAQPVDLVWAYGGANGERGSRDGDIGTEREPVTRFFQLRPEYCRGDSFEILANGFVLHSKAADIAGVFPAGAKLSLGDATRWQSWEELASHVSASPELPVAIGEVRLKPNEPAFLALQHVNAGHNALAAAPVAYPERPDVRMPQQRAQQDPALLPPYSVADLPRVFDSTEAHFRDLAGSLQVDTPDPFINAAGAAIAIAADGVWDEQQGAVMHGAVAWRARLLGWRGAYAMDALGWHDRMRRHLTYWAAQQNTSPIVQQPIHPDLGSNLTRTENALHSNGDISKNHYDMNLVYIDALMRDLLWTGDVTFARQAWPVIERHLAWERRLFRRTYGPAKLPLYEAYNAIWASDNLQYDGAGVTHSSAYNYYENKMAARIAQWIGKDPAPYETESAAILRAMQRELWLPQRGWYAESRDILGLQLPHPSPAAWTFFHTVDSEAATPIEDYQMSRFVDTQLGHIPIHGPGVPVGSYHVIAYTNWMPYMWSINNVVMGDNMHTALGFWQSGLGKNAFDIYKGNILDSMYMGLCPGDIHMSSQFDDYRQESQRDFADPIAMTARATVEGLFGVIPDMLKGEVRIEPGFPADWDHAAIKHHDFAYEWRHEKAADSYSIALKFPKPAALRLIAVAYSDQVAAVTVNGHPAEYRAVDSQVGTPRIEIHAPAATQFNVRIAWKGTAQRPVLPERIAAIGRSIKVSVEPARLISIADPQRVLTNVRKSPSSFDADVTGMTGHRTVFAQLRQGDLMWWMPVDLELRSPIEILASAEQSAGTLSFRVRNNTQQPVVCTVGIAGADASNQQHIELAQLSESVQISLPARGQLPGTTRIRATFENGVSTEALVTNWNIHAAGAHWDKVDLNGEFNDGVGQIFRNHYLSPRSPYVSLSIPEQGIGGWSANKMTADIDDSGLRTATRKENGVFTMPQGVPFQTPDDPGARNILFTSQWDNYPHQKAIPLSGRAGHVYLLMAGSTNPMQSRMDNGEVVVNYADGTDARLPLRNPETWWPIEQDYLIDDYQFPFDAPLPPRVDLKTGKARIPSRGDGEQINGGSATVLDLPLDPVKELRSLTVRTLANEVVIGLMSVTLAR
jgi:hypothetical protein